jgi:hypothetical protein
MRRTVVDVAGRLAALIDESETARSAASILTAQGVVSTRSTSSSEAPLYSALLGALPKYASGIAEYVRVSEAQHRGEEVVRFLSQLKPESRRSSMPLGVIGVEFIVALFVVLIYGIFVLPQMKAVMTNVAGVQLPKFTELVFALVSPLSPLIWIVALLIMGGIVWRILGLLFGRWMGPLDRLVLAMPVAGTRMRRYNSEQMSGWLGFAPADDAGRRAALDAARIWHRGVLSRSCARILANAESGRDVAAYLSSSSAFDQEFGRTLSNSNHDECGKTLRSRWRACARAPDFGDASLAALVHLMVGIVIGAIVIAMYLPLFKLAAVS